MQVRGLAAFLDLGSATVTNLERHMMQVRGWVAFLAFGSTTNIERHTMQVRGLAAFLDLGSATVTNLERHMMQVRGWVAFLAFGSTTNIERHMMQVRGLAAFLAFRSATVTHIERHMMQMRGWVAFAGLCFHNQQQQQQQQRRKLPERKDSRKLSTCSLLCSSNLSRLLVMICGFTFRKRNEENTRWWCQFIGGCEECWLHRLQFCHAWWSTGLVSYMLTLGTCPGFIASRVLCVCNFYATFVATFCKFVATVFAIFFASYFCNF